MVYDPDRVRIFWSPTAMRHALAEAVMHANLDDAALPEASREELVEALNRWFRRQPEPVQLAVLRAAAPPQPAPPPQKIEAERRCLPEGKPPDCRPRSGRPSETRS